MRLATLAAVALVSLFLTAACSSIAVNYDFDEMTDFASYRTYQWKSVEVPGDALANHPLVKKRVVAAVDRELEARGYVLAESGAVDFFVVTHAGVKEKMRIHDWGRYGWYDPWWGPYGGRVDVSYYEEGTLVVDIVDAGRKELVWRGTGTSVVKRYKDMTKMDKDIDETVARILSNFPPR